MKNVEQTFNTLVETHGYAIARVAVSYEANYAKQQELSQEILLAIWRALPNFEGRSNIKTFALSIAHKRAMTHVKSEMSRPTTEEVDDSYLHPSDNPHESLLKTQQNNKLLESVRELPVAQRQLVTLALEGVSYQDIAEIQGISVSNVGVRLTRAKEALKKKVAILNSKSSI